MGYVELYHNGFVDLVIAVVVAVLIMIFVLTILWAHSEKEYRMDMDHEALMHALENAHRDSVYGAAEEKI